MERDELIKLLQENNCEVTFTKVDGTERVMPCTLQESAIPPKPPEVGSKSEEKRQRTLDVVSVWCLDKQQWRSFKLANVKQIRVLDHKPA